MPRHPYISDAEYILRLKSKIRVSESGCWEWTGFQKPLRGMPHLTVGYGSMSYRGKSQQSQGWQVIRDRREASHEHPH